MKTLTINDLSAIEDLDHNEMAAIHGGRIKLETEVPAKVPDPNDQHGASSMTNAWWINSLGGVGGGAGGL